MRCIARNLEISYLKPGVIIDAMRSLIIKPRGKKEIDLTFDMLTEFAEGRKPLAWEGKGEIGFIFLMNEVDAAKEVIDKEVKKKLAR